MRVLVVWSNDFVLWVLHKLSTALAALKVLFAVMDFAILTVPVELQAGQVGREIDIQQLRLQ